jgi:hypothetical protein
MTPIAASLVISLFCGSFQPDATLAKDFESWASILVRKLEINEAVSHQTYRAFIDSIKGCGDALTDVAEKGAAIDANRELTEIQKKFLERYVSDRMRLPVLLKKADNLNDRWRAFSEWFFFGGYREYSELLDAATKSFRQEFLPKDDPAVAKAETLRRRIHAYWGFVVSRMATEMMKAGEVHPPNIFSEFDLLQTIDKLGGFEIEAGGIKLRSHEGLSDREEILVKMAIASFPSNPMFRDLNRNLDAATQSEVWGAYRDAGLNVEERRLYDSLRASFGLPPFVPWSERKNAEPAQIDQPAVPDEANRPSRSRLAPAMLTAGVFLMVVAGLYWLMRRRGA